MAGWSKDSVVLSQKIAVAKGFGYLLTNHNPAVTLPLSAQDLHDANRVGVAQAIPGPKRSRRFLFNRDIG
jgi:hypothetical protein